MPIVVLALVVLWLLSSGSLGELLGVFNPQGGLSDGSSATGSGPQQPNNTSATGLHVNSVQGLAATAIFNPGSINQAITGVSPTTFTTFGDSGDFQKLASNMCNCYHGNDAACVAVNEQAPGISNCRPGSKDCDCHPIDLGGGTVAYKTHTNQSGNLRAQYGKKVPVGGCKPHTTPYNNAGPLAENIKGGYCG
jgi:hypothetical protein